MVMAARCSVRFATVRLEVSFATLCHPFNGDVIVRPENSLENVEVLLFGVKSIKNTYCTKFKARIKPSE